MSGPREIRPEAIADLLPASGLVLVSSCSAESALLADAVEKSGDTWPDVQCSGIFVPGLNRRRWASANRGGVLSFFMTPEHRALGDRLDFRALCYQDIMRLYVRERPVAAMFMCSPPDADGYCSLGTEVDFIADLWPDIPVRIAHINPLMPRTAGDRGIPFAELTAWFGNEQVLKGIAENPPDPVAQAIASHVAPYIEDGATLQTGLGKIPDAVLDSLGDRRGLRFHTGLLGDAGLRLIRSGAMAAGRSALVGVVIGSQALYDGVDDPHFQFRPISVTHDLATLGRIDNLVTINSALEADLFGQIYSELTPRGLSSGPGGASDYARAGRIGKDGLRIIAFPASAASGTISRIVAPGDATGLVSLARWDVDLIVTEHGVADLRLAGYHERAEMLIAIADPAHRGDLNDKWRAVAARL